MESADVAFWFCSLLNVMLSLALAVYFRRRVKGHSSTEKHAKRIYSWLCVVIGLISGVALFVGVVDVFHISLGHAEILIAAPIFNLLLAGVLIIVGRVIIGWVPMRW